MTPPGYIPYLHTVRQPACGQVACFVADGVPTGEVVRASDMRRADGALVRFADQYRCTSCRRPVTLPLPAPDGRDEVEV